MTAGKNTLEGQAEPFLRRIENLFEDLETKRAEYMVRCKAIRDDIKIVYEEAKTAGVMVKALRRLVEYRRLERKQQALAGEMDSDDAAIYEQLVAALGELGMAAARRAGYDGKQARADAIDSIAAPA